MMKDINSLQEGHLQLLKQQEGGTEDDFIVSVKEYIDLVVISSSQIPDPEERDQLRSILRFWASFIYNQTGEYPNAKLSPAVIEPAKVDVFEASIEAKPEQVDKTKFPRWGWLLIGVIIFGGILGIFGIFGTMGGAEPPEAATNTVTLTPSQTITSTASPSLTPSQTSTNENTPTLTPTQTDTSKPTQFAPSGSFIQFSNIKNGQGVQPRMILEGSYSGLNPGNSIHILLQPITKCSTQSILNEDEFLVKETSGDWTALGVFGEGEDLSYSEQYNIRIAIAQNDEARDALKNNRFRTCFDLDELPLGVFLFNPLLVNVQRGKYVQIDEERLLFASSEGANLPYDIATTKLDGTDFRLLTNTSNTSEVEPNLCFKNQKIVYGEYAAREIAVGVLWVMNSDGSDPVVLLWEDDIRYEKPTWSTDCKYIAFGSRQAGSRKWKINILDYEDPERNIIQIGEGQYPTWIPGSHTLVFNRLGNPSGLSSFLTANLDNCVFDFSSNKSYCEISDFPERAKPRGKQPGISVDGRFLTYASFPMELGEDFYQILKVFDLETGLENNATQNEGASKDWKPTWGMESTPDYIFFESQRGVGYDTIWRVKSDGSNLEQITKDQRINMGPSIGYMKTFLPEED
jgi:hypothetical protein